MVELLSTLVTPSYLERVAVHTPQHTIRAKQAVRNAFKFQNEARGFSLVEVLSTCPTNWGKTPIESLEWLEEKMIPNYPLGRFKPRDDDGDS